MNRLWSPLLGAPGVDASIDVMASSTAYVEAGNDPATVQSVHLEPPTKSRANEKPASGFSRWWWRTLRQKTHAFQHLKVAMLWRLSSWPRKHLDP